MWALRERTHTHTERVSQSQSTSRTPVCIHTGQQIQVEPAEERLSPSLLRPDSAAPRATATPHRQNKSAETSPSYTVKPTGRLLSRSGLKVTAENKQPLCLCVHWCQRIQWGLTTAESSGSSIMQLPQWPSQRARSITGAREKEGGAKSKFTSSAAPNGKFHI